MKQVWDKLKIYWRQLLALLLFVSIISFLLAKPITPDIIEVNEGYPLLNNIYSEIDFETLDYEKSEAAGELASQTTPRCFRQDEQKMMETLTALDDFIKQLKEKVENARNKTSIDKSEDFELLDEEKKAIRALVDTEQLDVLGESWKDRVRSGILPHTANNELGANEKLFILRGSSSREIPVEHTEYYRKSRLIREILRDIYEDHIFNRNFKDSPLAAYLDRVITENLFPDDELTQEHQRQAIEKAKTYRKIQAGQLLLAKTNKLTWEDVQLYRSYRNALESDPHRGSSSTVVLYRLGVFFVLLVFIALYVYHQYPEIANNARAVWIWCGVILYCFLMARMIASGFFLLADIGGTPQWIVFLVLPLAVPSLLVTVIYGYRPAIYIGIFVSGIAACMLNNPFAVFVTGMLVSAISAFVVRAVIHYKQFFVRALLACSAVTVLCAVIFAGDYAFRSAPPETIVSEQQKHLEQYKQEKAADADDDKGKIFGIQVFLPTNGEIAPVFAYRVRTIFSGIFLIPVFAGLVAVSLAQLLLFILESCFRVTSCMSYLSYTDRNHKLLRELQIGAPGTYHHCERVSLLAENAASVIGLDRVRVQACALFHDIGKLKYPNMFTENNAPGEENMHRQYAPLQSVGIIKQHVAYGMELGKKNKLPPLLLRAIQSHHGTDFISFFYQNALKEAEAQGKPAPDEKNFHYDGPLASDKEVALIMLADCCEAAVQSIQDLTAEKVQNMVNMLFEKKQKNGQLDASPLTMKELHQIQKAFVDSLLSMHNKRISYPDQEDKNSKKQKGKRTS